MNPCFLTDLLSCGDCAAASDIHQLIDSRHSETPVTRQTQQHYLSSAHMSTGSTYSGCAVRRLILFIITTELMGN
jgi:hypothetical protein